MAKKHTRLTEAAGRKTAVDKIKAELVGGAPVPKPVRINVNVPAELHKQFRTKATWDNLKHQYILLAAIELYVSDPDAHKAIVQRAEKLQV